MTKSSDHGRGITMQPDNMRATMHHIKIESLLEQKTKIRKNKNKSNLNERARMISLASTAKCSKLSIDDDVIDVSATAGSDGADGTNCK